MCSLHQPLAYSGQTICYHFVVCIHGSHIKWETFVSNRTKRILSMTNANHWRHCPVSSNTADILTRRNFFTTIKHRSLWWHGPLWLVRQSSEWPQRLNIAHIHDLPTIYALNESTAISVEPIYGIRKLNSLVLTCHHDSIGISLFIKVTSLQQRPSTVIGTIKSRDLLHKAWPGCMLQEGTQLC